MILMDTRRTKQIIYGVVYLVVLIAVVGGGYFLFLKPTPSCFDHKQDGGETGVDCGGPCAAVCIPANLSGISTVGGVSILTSSSSNDTFLVQIANANAGFAAQSFNYSFQLYDASGTLLASIPGESFLYAGEVKYLIAPNVAAPATLDHATLAITNVDWVPAAAMGFVPSWGSDNRPEMTGNSISSTTVSVTGTLTDSDTATFTNVLVVAVFKDAAGDVVGASQTELDSIAPNQTTDFTVMYPATPNLDPALTALYAYALRP